MALVTGVRWSSWEDAGSVNSKAIGADLRYTRHWGEQRALVHRRLIRQTLLRYSTHGSIRGRSPRKKT